MCYSAESSQISFIIGSLGSIYLLNSKEPALKHAGIFLFAVVLCNYWNISCGLTKNVEN